MTTIKLTICSLLICSSTAFAGSQPAPGSTTDNTNNISSAVSKEEQAKQKAAQEKQRAKEEAQRAQDMAINCEKAQKFMTELQSKVRIRLTDSSGQMRILSTEEKEQEVAKTQEMIDKYCTAK